MSKSLFTADPNAADAFKWVDHFVATIPYAQASGMLVTHLEKVAPA